MDPACWWSLRSKRHNKTNFMLKRTYAHFFESQDVPLLPIDLVVPNFVCRCRQRRREEGKRREREEERRRRRRRRTLTAGKRERETEKGRKEKEKHHERAARRRTRTRRAGVEAAHGHGQDGRQDQQDQQQVGIAREPWEDAKRRGSDLQRRSGGRSEKISGNFLRFGSSSSLTCAHLKGPTQFPYCPLPRLPHFRFCSRKSVAAAEVK